MNNDPTYDRLRESRWRRKLTEAERAQLGAWLAAHPDTEADWEAEAGLSEALGRLPDVPLASNFTARVMQAVEREAVAARRQRGGWRLWYGCLRWLPRTAFAALAVSAALVTYRATENHRRAQMAESIAAISRVASLPSPEILQDFDAIRALPRTPPPDEQLLALFE